MNHTDHHDSDGGGPSVELPEDVTDLITGVPIPSAVRKNLFKAVHRLCSAAVDVPVAYLEGVADEHRAASAARVKLIHTTGAQIAQQMRTDPEYARRAVAQFGRKVLREQVNLDLITLKATEELKRNSSTSTTSDESSTIDDDWLNAFDAEAREKSTEDMQANFARLLAGEIQRPGSFSIRSVRLLSNLDKESATLFRTLCSACVSIEADNATIDVRVLSLGGQASHNALLKYGLGFGELNVLQEHGLIIPDYNSWRDYQPCIGIEAEPMANTIRLPMSYQSRLWALVANADRKPSSDFKLHGVALTSAGCELRRIVEIVALDEYTQDLKAFFLRNKLRMVQVGD